MNRKQSVKGGVWYIASKRLSKRGQKRSFFPTAGLLGSVAVPLIVKIAKPILKEVVGGRRPRRRRRCRRYA